MLDSPSLVVMSVHIVHAYVDVVDAVSRLWLSNLSVNPEEGSIILDISAGSSSVLALTKSDHLGSASLADGSDASFIVLVVSQALGFWIPVELGVISVS